MSGIFLQRMLETLPDGVLPANWADFDLAAYSPGKRLFEYQQAALHNALLALWKYYGTPGLSESERKQAFFAWYRDFGLEADLDLPLDDSSAAQRRLSAPCWRAITPAKKTPRDAGAYLTSSSSTACPSGWRRLPARPW